MRRSPGRSASRPAGPLIGLVLGATSERISAIRAKAAAADDTFIADMPAQAQETRIYAEYLANMSTAETIDYHAISLVGPRNRVSKLVHSIPLLP